MTSLHREMAPIYILVSAAVLMYGSTIVWLVATGRAAETWPIIIMFSVGIAAFMAIAIFAYYDLKSLQ